jgi:hypothetical protein
LAFSTITPSTRRSRGLSGTQDGPEPVAFVVSFMMSFSFGEQAPPDSVPWSRVSQEARSSTGFVAGFPLVFGSSRTKIGPATRIKD